MLRTVALATLLLSAAPSAWAGMTMNKSKITFNATGSPGFLTFEGVSKEATLSESDGSLVFTVPMSSVDTGIALRDEHMRDTYVEVAQFPNAELKLTRAEVTWPDEGGKSSGELKGAFTAHGVTVEVPVTYSIKNAKGTYKVSASFPFNTQELGIAIPSYLGVTIDPAMTADVSLELVDAP